MSHHEHVGEVELGDELTDNSGVLAGRVAVVGGAVGEPEPRIVDGNAPEAVAKLADHVSVEEAPGRVAVAHQDRLAAALIEVVDAAGGALKPA